MEVTIKNMIKSINLLFFLDKTYTGCISAEAADGDLKTEAQSTSDSVTPVWSNKDMCPVLSSEAEHFSFVSGFAKDISGELVL